MKRNQQTFVSPLMTPREASAYTTLSAPMLKIMSAEGRFPRARLIGERRVAFVRQEVEGWLAERIGTKPKHQMLVVGGAQ
ncbi:hypothetical protein A6U85_03785 [Agrobacterium sp. 13-626]|nr:hypothetical protein A6U85_03785 [Agrobacterium sp. 13-626]